MNLEEFNGLHIGDLKSLIEPFPDNTKLYIDGGESYRIEFDETLSYINITKKTV